MDELSFKSLARPVKSRETGIFSELKFLLLVSIFGVKSLGQLIFILWSEFSRRCSSRNIFVAYSLEFKNIIDTFIFDHLSHSTLLLIVFNFSNFFKLKSFEIILKKNVTKISFCVWLGKWGERVKQRLKSKH